MLENPSKPKISKTTRCVFSIYKMANTKFETERAKCATLEIRAIFVVEKKKTRVTYYARNLKKKNNAKRILSVNMIKI